MKLLMLVLLLTFGAAPALVAQIPLKSLTVGNRFIYTNDKNRYVAGDATRYIETVLRDTIIHGRRYAVVHSTFDNKLRFERSDENAIYLFRNGREETAHRWDIKDGDSITANFFGFDCDTCRYPVRFVRRFPDRFNPADTVLSFDIVRSTIPPPLGMPPIVPIYQKRQGLYQVNTGTMDGRRDWRIVWLQGAVLDGVVFRDTTSRVITVGVNDTRTTNASAFTSKAPNPFAESVALEFSLQHSAAQVELVVTALDGRTVARLPLGSRGAGRHTAQWNGKRTNGEDLASGAYIVSLLVNGQRVDELTVNKVK